MSGKKTKRKNTPSTPSYHTSDKKTLKNSFFRERKSVSNNEYLDTTPKTRSANSLLRLLEKRPQRLGVGGLKNSPPLRKRGVGGFDIKKVYTPLKTDDFHQSAPIEIGGAFRQPRPRSEVCKERTERREVLFAKGFAGNGKVKKAKWTQDSKVRC